MAPKQWATSRIDVDCTNFEWRIENFNSQPQKINESIKSPTFYSDRNKETEWQLQVYLNGDTSYGENHVTIYIGLKASTKPPVKFTCEMSAINPTNKTKLCKYIKSDALSVGKWLVVSKDFLPRAPLLDKNENYLMNDTLTIRCEIGICTDEVISSSMDAIETHLAPILSQHELGQDLMKVFTAPDDADVTIVVDDKKLRAHKMILIARSLVFAAMLSDKKTSESQKNEIEINDWNYNVVKQILKYMYTDKIDDRSLAMDLLEAAQMYELKGLQAKCAILIAEDLNAQNAANALHYADFYGPEGLKEYIIDFICDHEVEVLQSSGFRELEAAKPGLLAEIYKVQADKRKDQIKARA